MLDKFFKNEETCSNRNAVLHADTEDRYTECVNNYEDLEKWYKKGNIYLTSWKEMNNGMLENLWSPAKLKAKRTEENITYAVKLNKRVWGK